jgi:hypothetical protein
VTEVVRWEWLLVWKREMGAMSLLGQKRELEVYTKVVAIFEWQNPPVEKTTIDDTNMC